ncbi:hypothetical protein M569_03088 [Genlisea aurea]|uniref:PWI domain-containing protein n=1 Tax=Genlisea aurea TaxID=192259 RepID=S8CW77_9LAMI|nr:hypothetical protein M569_03088 [Genlisea aurea]
MAATTTVTSSAAVEPTPVSGKPESDSGPAGLETSSAGNPQFPNPSSSWVPSGLTPSAQAIQISVRPGGTIVRVPVPVQSASAGSQFLAVPAYQTPGIPPPGVNLIPPSIVVSSQQVGSAALPQVQMGTAQNILAPMRFVAVPNGYAGLQQAAPPGAMPPPGVPRYPAIYGAPMGHPAFPPRPMVGVMPSIPRPIVGVRGPVPPVIVKPPTPAEKPQTTVYVGKISSTVENDFLLSLLELCGPVKSWKRPQDPTGTLKGFGFCEFETAEGVLRALRLLNKLNVDGQELMLNVNQPTRVYLNLYVEKKSQSSKNVQETNAEGAEKDDLTTTSGADANGTAKSSEEAKKTSSNEDAGELSSKENSDPADFGLVTEEDRKADGEALEKLKGMIEERLKNRPLPPPPPMQKTIDGPSEIAPSVLRPPSKVQDSDRDLASKDSAEDKAVEENKNAATRLLDEIDKTGSPDRSRRGGDRGRDRDRESKRDADRYDRERDQERTRREKEYRSRDDDRRYKMREKEWEAREREKEHWRKKEREREKEKAQERKWEVLEQERDADDAYGKKRRYNRVSENERKRRQQEKEEDLADRLLEEEEIIQAKIREEEEKQKKQDEILRNGSNDDVLPSGSLEIHGEDGGDGVVVSRGNQFHVSFYDVSFAEIEIDYWALLLGIAGGSTSLNGDDYVTSAMQNSNAPTRKLGFGLSASGKRTAVPSVFHEDEDEDAHKEKKMRPLVPIDYSTEEQQAVHYPEAPPLHVAVGEFAKRIEKHHDFEKDRRRRSSHQDEAGQRKDHHRGGGKASENQKFLDAKQLIDTIPKTKDELFSYKINWPVYDQNMLHERLRPWIAKKITDFLGEEEDTLVEYIVSGTQEHVSAGDMLERLQTILDDEAEMFVLKMWRMLIFEIKKVETGLAVVKSRS